MRKPLFWAIVLSGAAAVPAAAAPSIGEVLTMDTQYAYQTGDLAHGCVCAGTNEDLSFASGFTRLGVQLTSTLGANGNFFFLHNLYAQGDGVSNMSTKLEIAITNNGSATANLRLDSLITPGFIAFQGNNASASASFNFLIQQYTENPLLFGTPTTLYTATGYLDATGPQANSIQTSNGQMFTGFSSYVGPGRVAYEWGATPLSLALLPIAAGATHYVQYFSDTSVQINGGTCNTLLGCEGVQVAFGDPRNDGSSQPFRMAAGAGFGSFSAPATNNQLLIGRRFDAANYAMANVVELTAPPPAPLPPPAPPATFDWLPPVDTASAVPEPSSWLLLITGFGLAGIALRRQRAANRRSLSASAW